jgi:hypothetical protein
MGERVNYYDRAGKIHDLQLRALEYRATGMAIEGSFDATSETAPLRLSVRFRLTDNVPRDRGM